MELGCTYRAMPRKAVQAMLMYKGKPYLCRSGVEMGGGYMCCSNVYEILALGVFKGTVGSLFEKFPFFLLLSLHNLLYTFLDT
jgi:hypothetical protein